MKQDMLAIYKLQDELTGALIGLVNACGNNPSTENTNRLILKGLVSTLPTATISSAELQNLIHEVHEDKFAVVPNCRYCESPCGNTSDYDMEKLLLEEDEEIHALKLLILQNARAIAANAYPALLLGYEDNDIYLYLHKALSFISFQLDKEVLSGVVFEAASVNMKSEKLRKRH